MLSKAQARYEEGDRYQALKLWEQALKQVQTPEGKVYSPLEHPSVWSSSTAIRGKCYAACTLLHVGPSSCHLQGRSAPAPATSCARPLPSVDS